MRVLVLVVLLLLLLLLLVGGKAHLRVSCAPRAYPVSAIDAVYKTPARPKPNMLGSWSGGGGGGGGGVGTPDGGNADRWPPRAPKCGCARGVFDAATTRTTARNIGCRHYGTTDVDIGKKLGDRCW